MPIIIFNAKGIKRPYSLLLFVLFTLHLVPFKSYSQVINARTILNTTFDSIEKIRTLYFRLDYHERISENGKMRQDSSTTKYQKSPRRVYMKMANGAELLWGPDINNGDVLIHPDAFPYFNLDLNPNGYWMRKSQHHGINEIGFAYIEDLLKNGITRLGDKFNSEFFYQGKVTFGSFKCYYILIIDPGFKYIPYTVQKGENIFTIASKLCLNEYMILKHNPKVSSYTDVKEGQSILVPNTYAMQIRLYIDENTMLPVMMRADDEKGLFEEYDYKELKVNPIFKSDEFSKEYKGYHF